MRRGFIVTGGREAHQQLELLIEVGELAREALELGLDTGANPLNALATPTQLRALGDGGAPEASGNV